MLFGKILYALGCGISRKTASGYAICPEKTARGMAVNTITTEKRYTLHQNNKERSKVNVVHRKELARFPAIFLISNH
jgi:hypothetical protein